MSKALSVDLRPAVLAQGASHRAAARFGVSAAGVSRWRALVRGAGAVRPGPL
ncbi:MAG: IS630 family transposase, partial [Paracoccaceae bacterium]